MKLSNLPWLCKCTSCLEKNHLYCDTCSKQIRKQDSVRIPTNPDTFHKVAICFTPQLPKHCLHPVQIFNLWCCAWEETFASQRGKASRRDGQIPCIEGRAVSVSHAHRRIWWRWRHWDGWKIGKKTEAKRVLLNKNSFDCRGCINPSCTNYIWFPNFKNWFCLRGRDHPIFQKPTAL